MLVVIHSKIKDDNLPMGFLTPTGIFYSCRWGKHEKFAGEYVVENNLLDEEKQWEEEGFGNVLYRDFLVKQKGWMLLDCPSDDDTSFAMFETEKITVKQVMYLVDYYVKLNDYESLNKLKEHINL